MEPVGRVVVGRGDEIDDARLGGAPGARKHRQESRLAGGDGATRRLAGMRAAPVEGLLRAMADRGERHEAPADDPVGDLEPAPDLEQPRAAVGECDLVSGQRLAGRQDPADRRAGRALPVLVTGAVGEMRDDEMARPALPRDGDRQLAIKQQPASAERAPAERERQAPEDRRTIGQSRQGPRVARVEPRREIFIGRVPRSGQVDRPRQRRRQGGAPRGHGSDPPDPILT